MDQEKQLQSAIMAKQLEKLYPYLYDLKKSFKILKENNWSHSEKAPKELNKIMACSDDICASVRTLIDIYKEQSGDMYQNLNRLLNIFDEN